jgi:phospholipid-binding lipoprotein MlaA
MKMKGMIVFVFVACALLSANLYSTANAEELFPYMLAQDKPSNELDETDEFSSYDEYDNPESLISDPIEGFNRPMFVFNDKLYYWVAKPVAQAWGYIPEPGRVGVRNFFNNLSWPLRFFNCLFQAKLIGAGTEFSRFFINTTLSVGFFDPANKWLDLPYYEEDFGQTLGVWGLGHGFFLTIPFVGPVSLRDGLAKIMDAALDPVTFIPYGGGIINTINERSLRMGEYEAIRETSLDPYIGIRDAYIQYRNALVEK